MAQWDPSTFPTFNQSLPILSGMQAGINIKQMPEELRIKQKMADIAMQNVIARNNYNQLQTAKLPYYLGGLAVRAAGTPQGQYLLSNSTPAMQNYLQGTMGAQQAFSGAYNNQLPIGSVAGSSDQMDSGQSAQPQTGFNNDIVSGAQDSLMSKLIKGTTPTRVQTQRYYGKTFNNFAGQIDDLMPVISQYAGVEGKAKLAKDKAQAALGTVNPDYEKYLTFTTYLAPQAANELMLYLGSNHTDSQVKQMMEMINPSLLATNPTLYKQRWDNLVKYANSIEPTISQSLAQVSGKSTLPVSSVKEAKNISSSNNTPQTVSSVPLGSIVMIDNNGNQRVIPSSAKNQALSAGWRAP